MISTITLKDVASYSNDMPVSIQTEGKKINLFYGLNGSGKSTIGKYLQAPESDVFKKCSIFPSNIDHEIMVYNQEFVRKNFYNIPDFQGVFTLSEENQEAELAILDATEQINKCKENKGKLENSIREINTDIGNEENALRESIWKVKAQHEGTSLDYCLEGVRRSKADLLKKVKLSVGSSVSNIDSLRKEASELLEQTEISIPNIPIIIFDVDALESDSSLSEIIVGSKDSYLSLLIEKLGNSDWVKSGIDFMKEDAPCPFCQQDMTQSIRDEICNLFDETYNQKVTKINEIYNNYSESIDNLKNKLSNQIYNFPENTVTHGFYEKRDLLIESLTRNLLQIGIKRSNPSLVISLTNTRQFIEDLNSSLIDIQKDIDKFNEKIKFKKDHLNRIDSEFWKIIYSQYSLQISASDDRCTILKADKQLLLESIENIKKEILNYNSIILENQKKITSIDTSVANINKQLKELGVEAFKIVKAEEGLERYKIVRPMGDDDDVYNSLSEGEKTLITFLYFLECALGSTNESSPVLINNRIIVIDDPISSLSHNYVYDIAALIHHKIFNEDFHQIFLLTHNLFFFHELLMLKNPSNKCPSGYKLYRVSKSKTSNVYDMKRDDLQNDYQMYWQIIKDSALNSSYAHMLPNAMRNILEHYFNFVHKKDALKSTLEGLGQTEADFKPLFRYINRESHSDSINLFDFEGIDVSKYIDKFRQIFVDTGFEEHYNNMMGIDNDISTEIEV